MARLLAILAALLLGACASAPPGPSSFDQPREVAPGVWVLQGLQEEPSAANRGRVVNIGFLVGPTGVTLIDTGPSRGEGEAVLRALRTVTDKPIVLAIDSHPHPENVLGNAVFADQGAVIAASQAAIDAMKLRCELCLKNLTRQLSEGVMGPTRPAYPTRALAHGEELVSGGRRLRIFHYGWTHTEGDLAVLDVETGTLFGGGLVYLDQVPYMNQARVKGWIHALEELSRVGATRVVPGHGPVAPASRLADALGYLTDLQAMIQAQYQEGASIIDLLGSGDLPRWKGLKLYATQHPLNVQHVFYEIERADLQSR